MLEMMIDAVMMTGVAQGALVMMAMDDDDGGMCDAPLNIHPVST